MATILLIAYHVIGSSPEKGLHIPDSSAFRYFAEYFAAIRMPTFAFIAGVVYALRPPRIGSLTRFAGGKVRRLLVPGAVAVSVYLVLGGVALGRGLPIDEVWRAYVTPYLHFWFLQAIFVILLTFGAVDALMRNRAELPLIPIAIGLFFVGPAVFPTAFGLASATYLLPFFVFGVIAQRHQVLIAAWRPILAGLSLLVVAALTADFVVLAVDGQSVRIERRSFYALTFGLVAPLCLLLVMPRLPGARAMTMFGLTVYLYHVIGTSMMRRALQGFAIDDPYIHLLLGVAAGVALPVALHLAADRWALSRRLVLGKAT